MQNEALRNMVLFVACLLVPLTVVVGSERSAATRLAESSGAASDVPIASAADEQYCSAQLKQIVRRVAGACGLLGDGGRGCKPADAKNVASMSGEDFNQLFTPLADRAHIIQFDSEKTDLDDKGVSEIEKVWSEKGGASFFFVVSRASVDGSAEVNTALSAGRAQSVMTHLQAKFPEDEDLKRVGLLWLGADYAQLDDKFCTWKRSRDGEPCTSKDINRSSFVAWIDCAI